MSDWWWCLTHGRVEQGSDEPKHQRLGPYGSEPEAQSALGRAQERTQSWDAEDEAWEEGEKR